MNYLERMEQEIKNSKFKTVGEFYQYRVQLKKQLRTLGIEFDRELPTLELEKLL